MPVFNKCITLNPIFTVVYSVKPDILNVTPMLTIVFILLSDDAAICTNIYKVFLVPLHVIFLKPFGLKLQ